MGIAFLQAALLIFVLSTLLWGISVVLKNASIVDIFWGFAFVVVNTFYFLYADGFYSRQRLMLVLVSLWGLRLTFYLAWRNIGKGEDFRYQEFRRKYGPERYWWVSYFQTFLLQGGLVMLISLPLLGVNLGTVNENLNFWDYLGMVVWCIGFVFETGGDYQLIKFKNDSANKGKVLNSGFWKYTRHPNYFGDSAVWWAFGIFSFAAGSYWQMVGALVMTVLIIKVSGVAMLEKILKTDKPEYREYIEKTSAFFPWFPKK